MFETGLTKYAGRIPPLDLSNVNVCPSARESMELRWNKINQPSQTNLNTVHKRHQHQTHYQSAHHTHGILKGSDGLPIDPRDWTRADVWEWLVYMAISEGLEPTPELAEKFPMNGKALCLMTLEMYLTRVPIGGKMLYRDFRVRLARAMSL